MESMVCGMLIQREKWDLNCSYINRSNALLFRIKPLKSEEADLCTGRVLVVEA